MITQIKNIGETVNSVNSKQKTFNRMMEETNERLAGVVKDRIPVSDTDKKALLLAQQKEFNDLLRDIYAEHENFLKGNN